MQWVRWMDGSGRWVRHGCLLSLEGVSVPGNRRDRVLVVLVGIGHIAIMLLLFGLAAFIWLSGM